jgi:NAD(P)-dependent dehydrogenase (short-subunit alcohol dehydrogenase family)
MNTSSSGRVVLVTGAAGNLGRAVAAAFHASGDRLALMDRDAGRLQQVFGPADDRQTLWPCDLLDSASVADAVARLNAQWGPVDVLCHVAGGFDMGPAVHETPDALLDGLFDLNARSLVHLARAVVPGMVARQHGRIVTVGAALSPPACAGRPGSRSRPCRCWPARRPWPPPASGRCATRWGCSGLVAVLGRRHAAGRHRHPGPPAATAATGLRQLFRIGRLSVPVRRPAAGLLHHAQRRRARLALRALLRPVAMTVTRSWSPRLSS